MVWAACGHPEIIRPFFFKGSVNANSHLDMITEKFSPAFQLLQDSTQIIFMQDGVLPHWAKIMRYRMYVNLPDRWIGRGTANDEHIPWPPRSPDLTPMKFLLSGYIKSKVYTRNYDSLDDLEASITAAFQSISTQMISASMSNLEKPLKKVTKVQCGHVEKQMYIFDKSSFIKFS